VQYGRSQIILITSLWESFNIAAAEALCCGCSLVGPHRDCIMRWFAAENCGTTAERYDRQGMVDALLTEIRAWEEGGAIRRESARFWLDRVAATSVARQIVRALRLGGK